jgi:hypothetical protein
MSKIKTIMRTAIQIGMIILTFGVGVIYPNHFLLSAITILAIGINIYSFIKDKRELRQAHYYVRPSKRTNILQTIGVLLIIVAVGVGSYYLIQLIPKEIWKDGMTFYVAIIILSTYFANYYQHFKSSIRSFDYGIVIPKFQENKINWNSINSISIKDNSMILVIQNEEKIIFEIDKRDIEDAVNIKDQFEKICL